MKQKTPEDLKDLRIPRKEKTYQMQETSSLRKMKKIVVWFIIIAFVLTSGLIVAGFRGGNRLAQLEKEREKYTKGEGPEKQKQLEIAREIDIWEKQTLEEPNVAKNYFNLAYAYLRADNIENADKNFKKFLEMEPNDAHNYFNVGDSYLKEKEYDKAREYLGKAVEMAPEVAMYSKYLAESYVAEKKPDKALEVLTSAIKKQPNEKELYALAGQLYFEQKKNKEAEAMYAKVKEIDPGELSAYALLACLQAELGKKDESAKTMDAGLEVAKAMSQEKEYYSLIGQIFFQQKRFEDAEKVFMKARKVSPNELSTYAMLAYSQKELGKKEEAIKTLDAGLEAARAMNDERNMQLLNSMKEQFLAPEPTPEATLTATPSPTTTATSGATSKPIVLEPTKTPAAPAPTATSGSVSNKPKTAKTSAPATVPAKKAGTPGK